MSWSWYHDDIMMMISWWWHHDDDIMMLISWWWYHDDIMMIHDDGQNCYSPLWNLEWKSWVIYCFLYLKGFAQSADPYFFGIFKIFIISGIFMTFKVFRGPRAPPGFQGIPGEPWGTPGKRLKYKKKLIFYIKKSILLITPLCAASQTLKPIFLASWDSNASFF